MLGGLNYSAKSAIILSLDNLKKGAGGILDKFLITLEDSSIKHLSSVDERLSCLISRIGAIECNVHEDPFSFVVEEIVGQMLSNKVSDVICGRLLDLCNNKVDTQSILGLSVDDLRSIGISRAKSQYILNFANAVNDGQIVLSELENLSDDDVTGKLMSVKGVGIWTAKMYLIFVLKRPNVLPYEDGAFKQSYQWLYDTDDYSKSTVEEMCIKWEPYKSIAARYLYRALDMGLTKNKLINEVQ